MPNLTARPTHLMYALVVRRNAMAAIRFKEIARELPELLGHQMKALVGRSFNDLASDEKAAYRARTKRIRQLRSQLDKVRKAW